MNNLYSAGFIPRKVIENANGNKAAIDYVIDLAKRNCSEELEWQAKRHNLTTYTIEEAPAEESMGAARVATEDGLSVLYVLSTEETINPIEYDLTASDGDDSSLTYLSVGQRLLVKAVDRAGNKVLFVEE